jgi:predicted DNA-binding antitoxin AbrB/MazE fold protein
MTVGVDAVYEDGVFKPHGKVSLKEKTKVHLVVESIDLGEDDDPTGWKTADELIGFVQGGPQGSTGRDHDEYLYK